MIVLETPRGQVPVTEADLGKLFAQNPLAVTQIKVIVLERVLQEFYASQEPAGARDAKASE